MRHAWLPLLLLTLAACEAPNRPIAAPTRAVSNAPDAPPRAPAASPVLERLGIAVRPSPSGLVIIAVDLDGPAAQGGVRVGDVLLGVNGARVASAPELDRAIAGAPAGVLSLDLLQGGQPRVVSLSAAPAEGPWSPLGLQLRELAPETLKGLGLSYGLMVAKIRSPADRTRILPGDVIMGVEQTRIRSLEEFNRLVAARADGPVGLLVRRSDSDLYIAISAGAAKDGDASRGGSAPLPPGALRTRATGRPLRI
jgi:S1-C subfamily serine protease